MARSTLELLLDSIKDKEEGSAEELPWLPKRPLSRARLPSSKVRSSLLSGEHNLSRSNGNLLLQTSSTMDNSPSKETDGSLASETSVRLLSEKDHNVTRSHVTSGMAISDVDRKKRNDCRIYGNSVEKEGRSEGMDAGSQHKPKTFSTDKESMNLVKKQKSSSEEQGSIKKRKRDSVLAWRKGSRVWFLNQECKWIQGVIQSTDDLESTVSLRDGQVISVQYNMLLPANPSVLDDVDDLIQLSYINDPSILHVLQRRYEMGKIYTRAGSMLIAIASSMGKQSDKGEAFGTTEQPHLHVHAILDNAFKAMKRDGMNQSVIISGENDVDKSETIRAALQHLASCGANPVLLKLLSAAQTILGAFTSAKLSDKTNVNCAGETIDLYYNKFGILTGAEWKTVLFEKSRVVQRDEGEQSYNIFYQLCEGADSVLREKLNLLNARGFDYLSKSGLGFVNGTDYCSQFQSIIDSFCALGINKQEQEHIFMLLGAILWLGNISLPAPDNRRQALENAAMLLQCSVEQLLKALSDTERDPAREMAAKDLMAQHMYARLLRWLINKINKVLKSDITGECKFITIVNMPDFGSSKRKGLGGLLVNYSYEYLQQFTKDHLSQPEEEHMFCGQRRIGFAPNAVIEFLEQVLFPFLEDVPKGNTTQRLETLIANSTCCKQKNGHEFSIYHIFQEVTYCSKSIIEGTNNYVGPELLQILNSCSSWMPHTAETCDSDESYLEMPFTSTCQEWVQQMMQQLRNSTPRFVLCIMPSKSLSTMSFDQEFVLNQLQLNRVTEAVRALRTGCMEQMSHQLFAHRFGILLAPGGATGHDALGVCIGVLQRLNIPPYMYRVGLRNIFFHPEQIDKLEDTYKRFLDGIVAVQKTFRGHKVRHSFKKQKSASKLIQAVVRGWLARKSLAHPTVAVHMDRLIVKKDKVNGDMVTQVQATGNGDVKYTNKVDDLNIKGLANKCNRGQDWQGGQDEMRAALQRKEEENAILQQTVKEYERKWVSYEAKMKSMEEMWMKQIATLQQNLSDTAKGIVKYGEQDGGSVHHSEGNTPDVTPRSETNTSRSEFNPSRSVINQLARELEQRTQVFNDDVGFLVEVKSGPVEANFKPSEELQKLNLKFELWKKDFKVRLKETKNILKKLGKSDSAEAKKKKWWGVK